MLRPRIRVVVVSFIWFLMSEIPRFLFDFCKLTLLHMILTILALRLVPGIDPLLGKQLLLEELLNPQQNNKTCLRSGYEL